ncbi:MULTISPECIES: OpgC domain-containing protein [unclassified Caballeronia]|uniref:OpgC domain-containing protein n=1 Tax=unclassified Caballeronia TaxID=2646786 RepID=UPI00285B87CB|nr:MULTISPECIES: OpgC domain-containing protein [unclassified Caballeronia]MDR5818070.1 OpgC domain-containing protein [Caballeronia sp. LZ033]MDR5825035.1 OpgC domain-containing protein [Caballeronia sp. LZ043]MDR5882911.1 OpgC domain-containing protein [Caballeronia sp. LZ032]
MQGKSQRLVELDFFRGLVLLIIVVDHIGGSMVSRFTLHAFALNDAAEVFVFLGGFATATAYVSLAERRSESVARRRFVKRAFELYRAFLVTAVLMLAASFLLRPFFGHAPNLALHDLDSLMAEPVSSIAQILTFERQPYLAAVLPMYALFALAVPLMLPLARSKPWILLGLSLALWACAPAIGEYLPSAEDNLWDFNPAAWQLMFVLGVLARCQPVYQRVSAHRFGWIVSAGTVALIAGMAYYKLLVLPPVLDSAFKRDLAGPRIVNFLAIAWICANLARYGVVKAIANRLPWIGAVGRDGMVAFVAGTVISLVVDSVLFTLTDGLINVPAGLAADALAIGALLAVPRVHQAVAGWLGSRRPLPKPAPAAAPARVAADTRGR